MVLVTSDGCSSRQLNVKFVTVILSILTDYSKYKFVSVRPFFMKVPKSFISVLEVMALNSEVIITNHFTLVLINK